MKKNVYTFVAAAVLICAIAAPAKAQLNRGAKKISTGAALLGSNEADFVNEKSFPDRPVSSSFQQNSNIPEYDQINAPIRWYAIENENNTDYWESVNINKIWVGLDPGITISDAEINEFLSEYGLTNLISESRRKHQTNYWIFELTNASPDLVVEMAKAARNVEGIQYLEPSVIYQTHYTPNDPLYNLQWGPYVTYFDEAWDQTTGGNSYNVVAVIDDACDWNHEDLYDQVWYGWDYAMNDFDISPDDPLNHKHGTHTTGTVAATINNNIGVAGMINDTVYFAKVGLPDGTLSDEGIVNAYYDIAEIDRITAVNMSFGGSAPSTANEQGVNFAWNNGKLLLVSSGNEGTGTISYPAAYPAAMAVGSIGTDGSQLGLATYSQFGNEQEISAPGGETQFNYGIVSCIPLNEYESMQGTSMAAPHVTGLAGLLKHVNMDLTNADIRNIINATAIDLGSPGWDVEFGYGMINAGQAVQAALNGSVGVAELNNEDVLHIYPNPSSDQILVAKKIDFQKGSYDVIDITGKIIKSVSIGSQKLMSISVSELPAGVYILRMNSEIGTTATRFVKI